MGQETLVYIDDNDKTSANIMAKSFAHNDVKNRTYFNTIGASLISKYLSSENINTENITGLHSIKKVLEEIDVSDILLPNIRIDVRVVFDENIIFVPKSHFEYDILPDIYVVVKASNDLSNVEILGFFEPSLINKNNKNDKYYFIEKEKLSPSNNLYEYIKNYKGLENQDISDDELEAFEQLIISFSDNDVSENDKKYLIKQLYRSAKLREKCIEYENFETLSYKAMMDPMVDVPGLPQDTVNVDEFDMFDSELTDDLNFEPIVEPEIAEETIEEPVEESTEEIIEDIVEEPNNSTENAENILDGIDTIDENVLTNASELGNLTGAIEGFEAVEAVSDTMGDILFDDETVKALDGIDEINSENQEEALIEPIEQNEPENILEENVEDLKISDEDTVILNDVESEVDISENIENDNISVEAIEPLESLDESVTEDNAISFDTIIPPDIEAPEENIAEDNALSFDTIIPPDVETPEEDVAEDNKLSFDTIIPPDVETLEEDVAEDNKLSFDTIIPPDVEAPEEEVAEDNKLSFDTIEPPEIGLSNEDNAQDNLLSFDTIEAPQTGSEEKIEEEGGNLLSFDDIAPPETKFENSDNEQSELVEPEQPEVKYSDNIDEIIPSENVESNLAEDSVSEETDFEEISNAEDNLEDIQQVEEGVMYDDNFETITNIEQSSESFGKNLLENLNEESLNNIVIEGVDDNSEPENLSSEELLSQIDDVLLSSAQIGSEKGEENSFIVTDDIYETVNSNGGENKLDVLYNEQAVSNTENNFEEISEFGEIQPSEQEVMPLGQEVMPSEQEVLPSVQEKPEKQGKTFNKKTLVAAVVLVVIFAGLSIMTYLRPKNNSTPDIEPISNNTETTTNELNNQTNNILESNAPQEVKTEQVQQVDKSTIQDMKNTSMNKPVSSGASMNVSKLVWDAPASVSSNPQMQSYLKSTGKSIKLSLSTDLLLASEYAYTNLVKVNVTIGANGNAENVSIVSGSGSTEIDNIVLQSVNDTLRAIKPPRDALMGQPQQLTLIIYF